MCFCSWNINSSILDWFILPKNIRLKPLWPLLFFLIFLLAPLYLISAHSSMSVLFQFNARSKVKPLYFLLSFYHFCLFLFRCWTLFGFNFLSEGSFCFISLFPFWKLFCQWDTALLLEIFCATGAWFCWKYSFMTVHL